MGEIQVSAVAARDGAGRVLIAMRTGRLAGFWEFPGGKRETGETAEDCAVRELKEELGLSVTITKTLYEMSYAESEKRLYFTFLEAKPDRDNPPLCLSAHSEARWVSPGALKEYPFCPADAAFIEIMKGRW